jgi:hypothetical protein
MSHNFDTGLGGAQRTLIRNGAVFLLAGLLKTAGGYLQAVIPWGGIVRGYTDDQGIDELAIALEGRSPAIAIALGDCTLEPVGIGGFNFTGEIELARPPLLEPPARHSSSADSRSTPPRSRATRPTPASTSKWSTRPSC